METQETTDNTLTKKRRIGRPRDDSVRIKAAPVSRIAFIAWQDSAGYNNNEAGRRLGVGPNCIVNYRKRGAPGRVGLAMLAASAGWRTYSDLNRQDAAKAARLIASLKTG